MIYADPGSELALIVGSADLLNRSCTSKPANRHFESRSWKISVKARFQPATVYQGTNSVLMAVSASSMQSTSPGGFRPGRLSQSIYPRPLANEST